MLRALPQFPGDTGPRLPPASCPAWAVPWVSPQGSSFLPPGKVLGQSHNPRGHSTWPWRLPSPASHRLQDTSAPPVSKLGQWPELVPVPGSGRSHTPCEGGLSPQGPFFSPRNMSQSGNLVLTSLRHRGAGTMQGTTPDTAQTIGLTPLSLRDGPTSFLWRDHYTSKFLPPAPDFSP